MTKHLLFLFVLLTANCIKVNAQTDTSFWFAAPEIGNYRDQFYLRVTTLDDAAEIIISQPATPGFTPIVQTVAANSSHTFVLTPVISQIETTGSDVTSDKGLLITSTKFIQAYYEVSNPVNTDIYPLKGNSALGNSFVLTGMKRFVTSGFGPKRSTFYIVAKEDNTTITITPSVDLIGHSVASGSYTVMLNKGQVYCGESTSDNNHVGGTFVDADKPIAITINADLTLVSSCGDVNGDQEIPISKAGKKFITVPGYLSSAGGSDFVYIYPTEDNTIITVNNTPEAPLNKGQYKEIISSGNTNIIESDKPVLVYHLSGFGCEVGGGVIPQAECTGSQKVGLTRSTNEDFFINLLVSAGSEGNFLFNGSATIITAPDFSDVPGTSGQWKYARKSISTGNLPQGTEAIISNPTPFHLGVIHGGTSSGCRYGYFSGFAVFTPEVTATNNGEICTTSGISTELSTSFAGTNYQWNRNGISINDATSSSYTALLDGSYTVDVTYNATCGYVRSFAMNVVDLCPLPLNWLFVSATEINRNAKVTWGTSHEENTSHFIVEHAVDGVNFKQIGTVAASGNNAAEATYSFFHNNPGNGIHFYRIKQVDNDGKYTYSKIIKLQIGSQAPDIRLAPNPAGKTITIIVPERTSLTSYEIYDVWGRLKKKYQLAIPVTTNISIPLSGMPAGSYLLRLNYNGNQSKSLPFIKLEE